MRDSFTVNNPHFHVWSDATCHMDSGKQKETSVALAELAKPILSFLFCSGLWVSGVVPGAANVWWAGGGSLQEVPPEGRQLPEQQVDRQVTRILEVFPKLNDSRILWFLWWQVVMSSFRTGKRACNTCNRVLWSFKHHYWFCFVNDFSHVKLQQSECVSHPFPQHTSVLLLWE